MRTLPPALFCLDESHAGHSLHGKKRPDVSLRSAVRASTPNGLRLAVARVRRAWRDSGRPGPRPQFAARPQGPGGTGFTHRVLEIVQEIKPTAFLEGKLVNIGLGASRLDGVIVAPGEIFSFWKLVGSPSAANGFQVGRSIRGDMVSGEVGGGLCQVSGIAYEAGLRAGLTVVERHPHSRDLYAEDERFTPLGLDATVVWPYKDLRLLNGLTVPVQFHFAVRDGTIAVSVRVQTPMAAALIEIERADHEGWRSVRITRRAAAGETEKISDDRYTAPAMEFR